MVSLSDPHLTLRASPLRGWPLASALALLAVLATPAGVVAQEEDSRVTTSALIITEGGATAAQRSIVNIGLRRGITAVEGVRFVHPVDQVSRGFSEEVQEQIDQLDAIADMVRTGDAEYAYQQADAAIRVFEGNLRFVRRAQLVDAYMLAAVGRCRAGRRDECRGRLRDIVAFREVIEYDAARYGPEVADIFEEQKLRALSGPRGVLIVETEPEGVEVYVDGRSYGPSPIRADGLLAGRHYVTIKELGYDEMIVRAEVRAGRETTERYTLVESADARRVLDLRDGIRQEVGDELAGQDVRSLASSLGTTQVIVGILRPAAGNQVHVQLYLYHVHTRLLQSRAEATVSTDEAGMERARQLAMDLYEGVDLTGGIEAPDDAFSVAGRQPELYEQWWFWLTTIGGAAVVVGAITAGVLLGGGDQVPGGFIRLEGSLP